MDFNELRIFLAVAREGSVSRAAERLNYVQSNVTARIRQLEARLNVTLFHRLSRGVALTGSGEVLLDYAERIIRLANEAERVVRERDMPIGRLAIGSMETTAAVRLPGILAAFHRNCPQVDLQLVTGTSEESLARLLGYRIDGAFVGGAVTHPELVAEKVFNEELVLVAGPGGAPEPGSAPQNILVFRAGCSYRARLEGWLRETGQLPYRVMEFGSIEAILGCVSAGMGITFLPRSVVERPHFGSGVSIHPLPPEVGGIVTWFARRRNEEESAAMARFRQLVQAQLDIR